jgi:hypothetical protein
MLGALRELTQRNPAIESGQALLAAHRQRHLLEIIEALQRPLARDFRMINPMDGKPTTLPAAVLQELVLDGLDQHDGLDTWVPELFVEATASRLATAFRITRRDIREVQAT